MKHDPPHLAFLGSSTAVDGGSELCLFRMVERLREDYRISVFLPDRGPLFQKIETLGVDAVSLGFLRLRAYRGLDWLRWWRSQRRAFHKLVAEIHAREIDLIHFNDLIDLPYAGAARKTGIPGVTHLRLILASRFARTVYRWGIRRSRCRVLAVSEAVGSAMLGEGQGIPSQVLYDPAPDPNVFYPIEDGDPEERIALRRSWGWEDRDFVVTLVSKLLPNKGHLGFCEVAAKLERAHAGRFRFLLVAGDTPGREGYRKQVAEAFSKLPETSRKRLNGAPHKEVPALLRASDVLLHLPSVPDSFPGVVLEAMACGTPVVAYRTGGIPEQLEEGKAGCLVEPGDTRAVAAAVLDLEANDALRAQIRSAALGRVQTEFSAARHFAGLKDLYARLLSEKPGPH